LEDHVKFPSFPRIWNGDVIVDCHPEYPPITPQESDTNNTSTVFKAIFGNYASRLQNGKPVWLEDGLGTCFTMIHLQQAMNSVIPGTTLRSVHYSDDEEAHFLAINHFISLGRSVIFKLTLIKSPHFCAVIHENNK